MSRRTATRVAAGSEAHKAFFCKQFIDTHQDYDPETLPWPELNEVELGRLRGVPFWQEVYHTERRAGAIVDAFTPQVADPVVREAVALQGLEERRHADLIRVMTPFSASGPSRPPASRSSCPRACSRSSTC